MPTQKYPFIPFKREDISAEQMHHNSQAFYKEMNGRRTVRELSSEPIDKAVIANIIRAAGTAPSGANKQPWTFCAVSNPELKKKIRIAAEKEEKESYEGRMSEEWLRDLAPLGTDWHKPFLETAPWLIVVFKKAYDLDESGKRKNYYVNESVGLACGMLLAAIHRAGLSSLTHTPSPMDFLCELLKRPENERPFLLIPVGKPAANAMVPDIQRFPLEGIVVWHE